MIERKIPGLYEILPGLYQSGAPGTRTGPSVFEIIQTGIDTVVCLYSGSRVEYPTNTSVIHLHFGDCASALEHPDDHIPDEDVRSLATYVRSLVGHGHNVLVHCQAGFNRSGLVNALVLRSFGYPTRDAIAMVRRGRGPEALFNTHFTNYLESLDA